MPLFAFYFPLIKLPFYLYTFLNYVWLFLEKINLFFLFLWLAIFICIAIIYSNYVLIKILRLICGIHHLSIIFLSIFLFLICKGFSVQWKTEAFFVFNLKLIMHLFFFAFKIFEPLRLRHSFEWHFLFEMNKFVSTF